MCSPPIVGRQRQRRQLREAATPPALVLLAGTAGTGKTRLLGELQDTTTVLTGHCPPRTDPFPLAPLVEALRHTRLPTGLSPLCGALRPLLPEHIDDLPAPPPPPPTPAAGHHLTYRALTELLHRLGPTVLALEDLQWADPATRDLLTYLAPRLPPHLALILTYRPEELPRTFPTAALTTRTPPGTRHHHITLGPLTPDDLHTLATHMLAPTPVTAQDAHRLHTWTGGLPLPAVHTLRHLARHPTTGPAVPASPPVPPPLHDWIREHLHRLDRDTRHLLRAAAVLDRPADEALLSRVSGLAPDRAARALSRAHRKGLLITAAPATAAPATPLLAHVCRQDLPHGKHRRLHRAAHEALADQPGPPHARLAHHARHAGLLPQWTDHAEQAAEAALAQGEDTTALTLLHDALTRPDLPTRRRYDLTLTLGRAALTGVSTQHTLTLLRQAMAAPALTGTQRGRLRMALGLLLLNQAAQGRAARDELVRATAELADRPDLAARAMCALAVPHSTPDPVDTHRRWMHQALATAARIPDPGLTCGITVNHATFLAQIGDPAAWQIPLPAPDTSTGRRERARACLNLADAAVMLGHYDRADRHLADAARWSPAAETPYIHESAQTLRLMLDWARGHWSGLAQETERNLTSPRLAHLHPVTAELTLLRAALALAHGRTAAARTHLDRLRGDPQDGTRPDHAVPVQAFAAGLLARLAASRSDHTLAWEHVADLVALVEGKGIWVWAADLVPGIEALLPTGRADQAQNLCARLDTGLEGTDAPAARAALLRLQAALAHHRGDREQALDLYGRAETAYRAMPRPYDAAQIREATATVHLTGPGTTAEGLGALHTALARYTDLGATWDAARVRRLLRAHGVPTAATAPAGGDRGLSPREAEIAALAAQGRTNRQIAALLHLSPRTVETHVANALAKLDLSSRRELAAHPGTGPAQHTR
ncbi:AAA family ATPase [Nocardiopsis algeriensis]|uniref:ATP-binding protein n=1 Tax=Nocardiopsis algeriensis TaxID=1478215 RepID=UPI003B430F85